MKKGLDAVILAAGLSSRAGSFKMELDMGGVTLLGRNVELFSQFCDRVFVVGGYKIERVRELIKGYEKALLLENIEFQRGMFRSVLCGLRLVRQDCFICPGDCPLISKPTLEALIQGEGDIRVPVYKGKKGHPLWVSAREKKVLLSQDPSYNLRDYVEQRGYEPITVPDKGILVDIDWPQDYQRCLHEMMGEINKGETYEAIS